MVYDKYLGLRNHPVSGEMDVKSGGKSCSTIEAAEHSTYIFTRCYAIHVVEFRGICTQSHITTTTTTEKIMSDP
jgi:hypothetical protein